MADETLAESIAKLGSSNEAARVAGSDAIAKAAERGDDVSAALPALAGALSDGNTTVRGNAAWLFAFVAQKGADLGAQIGALAAALGDAQTNIARNVAWALAQTAPRSDISPALPGLVAQLAHDGTFMNARAALAAALASPHCRTAALRAVEESFDRGEGALRTRAAMLLVIDKIAHGDEAAVEARARHADWYARFGVVKALAERGATGALSAAGVSTLASLLSDESAAVRQAAAGALIDGVEHGVDIAAALPSLARALADAELPVRKEAIWACAMAALRGTPLGPARPALEACASDDATRGNASLGLFFDDLRAGRRTDVEAQLGAPHGDTQFAAAYALTEHAAQTGDRALVESVARRIRVGISDIKISQGIAGAIVDRQRRGEDPRFAYGTIKDMIDATTDPLVQTPLMGILMNIQRATSGD